MNFVLHDNVHCKLAYEIHIIIVMCICLASGFKSLSFKEINTGFIYLDYN